MGKIGLACVLLLTLAVLAGCVVPESERRCVMDPYAWNACFPVRR